MMKIIEVLETDHIAIRLLNRCIAEEMDVESFKSFHDFIVNLHAKIEDDILFTTLRETYKDHEEILYLIDRIHNDHLLLRKLGDKVIEYGEKEEKSMYKKRLDMYMKILIDHNRSEEKLLFPLWENVSEADKEEADKKALDLVHKFGYGKYTSIIKTIGGKSK